MSITEAMQQAVVPVIATARYSGTSAYALDERSVFPEGDTKALAERIDYWFDHPQKRWAMGFRYAESMKKYEIANCAQALIDMFQKAIDAKNNEKTPVRYPLSSSGERPAVRTNKRIA